MGCSASSTQKVPKARRRLTVGQVEAEPARMTNVVMPPEVEEPSRGFLSKLDNSSVLELLNNQGTVEVGRRMSLGSQTDERRESFANKTVQQLGDEVSPERLGFTCRKGLKPESPNQDSWFYMRFEDHFSFYGVFDGHGQKGHDVSEFVKDNLPKILLVDERFKEGADAMTELLKDSFMKVQDLIDFQDKQKKLNAKLSGSTATVALHDHENNLVTVAHVADSVAALGKFKEGRWEAQQLTREHKPNLKDERARIEKAGGKVVYDGYANYRIYAGKNNRYPGLNMSRCLGDLMGHKECGMTCEPEVTQFHPTEEDKMLLLCSDGVWEFMTPVEAVKVCSKFPPDKAMDAATELAKEAWDRWIYEEGGQVVDDITVVLQFFASAGKEDEADPVSIPE